ncbi:hypothetical protein SLEP1_g8744 [Rubroshorea leprosula]|uniref:MINDY deubiquitinase domain-containing protein n=1 Tax=Rubroshorea leprosula TaxID=152421 RepID=A0AAV5I8R3_9ROSI|nr:hypothetical protein SLEP1_g8744 [Rubroshorea leprosula]
MASAAASPSSPANEEPQAQNLENDHQQQPLVKECVYRTKTMQFFGRTTPIILQNDNGPCPLLAICNVLLLRNNIKLSPDISEVSQEKLLSLVVERLIDSNSNVNNKDDEYLKNQQQNIADAMNLLPRLTTGIDVNIKFRRIDDFEFTPECAIFDLLDIPLCHGWIVDPQDYETSIAIGSKSYNTIMGELVALDTQNMEGMPKNNSEDCVDFAAATTATLGVPSPSLSKTRSFDSSPSSVSDPPKRRGDLEEEEELSRVLKLSETESTNVGNSLGAASDAVDGRTCSEDLVSVDSVRTRDGQNGVGNQNLQYPELSLSDNCNDNDNATCLKRFAKEEKIDGCDHYVDQSSFLKSGDIKHFSDVVEKGSASAFLQIKDPVSISPAKDTAAVDKNGTGTFHMGEKVELQSTSTISANEQADKDSGCDRTEVLSLSLPNADSESSSGRILPGDVSETVTSSLDDSEPIYEGEECILDSGTKVYHEREPVYEGEVILAEQADKGTLDTCDVRSKDEITAQQGELIRNFLKNNANQLTVYGLFCLQDGLKERELCVFFRNNHFSTMFKYEGDLYLLATDQGYLNQPDLVWEKLNEVNGDTLFMTSNFKEFKVDSHTSDTWDEHNAMANTADFIASIDSAAQAGLDINSDLQLAIALQQQEFEQQQQRQNVQQPTVSGASRLVTGPQVPRNSGRQPSTPKAEAKSKEKCIVM